eukprot:1395464-Pleurochrysis_carterae.AAC.4
MNGNQSRNLQSESDPRDRGSSASIARPRKPSILPVKTAMTPYCRCNYLHKGHQLGFKLRGVPAGCPGD